MNFYIFQQKYKNEYLKSVKESFNFSTSEKYQKIFFIIIILLAIPALILNLISTFTKYNLMPYALILMLLMVIVLCIFVLVDYKRNNRERRLHKYAMNIQARQRKFLFFLSHYGIDPTNQQQLNSIKEYAQNEIEENSSFWKFPFMRKALTLIISIAMFFIGKYTELQNLYTLFEQALAVIILIVCVCALAEMLKDPINMLNRKRVVLKYLIDDLDQILLFSDPTGTSVIIIK